LPVKALIITASTLIILSSTVLANWFGDLYESDASPKASVTPAANNSQLSQTANGLPASSNLSNRANINKSQNNRSSLNSFAPIDFDPLYSPSPQVNIQTQQKPAPKQDFKELRIMWEAQRKQAEEMLKRIDEAEKSASTSVALTQSTNHLN